LSTKGETPLKPGLTKELAKDYAILAVENAGTAAGSAPTVGGVIGIDGQER
jgi:hypothetical protein